MKKLVLAAALALAPAISSAQDLEALKAQLESAKQALQMLEQRVLSLEAEKARAAAATAAAAPAARAAPPRGPAPVTVGGTPVVAPNLSAEGDKPDPDRARLEIYGFVQADGIYDFNRVDPAWNATLRPSKIPVNCPGDAGCGNDGETIGSVRQSRLGARGYLPTDWGTFMTRFEFDLFGVGSDAGKTTMRVRHVYGELGQVLAGQTNSVFMDGDVFPNVVDYWGPIGMISVRNPQVRWTPWTSGGTHVSVALETNTAGLDAGNVATLDPSLGSVRTHNRTPDFTAHIKSQQSWGHVQFAGLAKLLSFETPGRTGSDPSGDEFGYGLNLSGSIKTWGKDKILAAFTYGEGISGYINDCCVDLAPNANQRAESVPLFGWMLYYDHYWSEKWSSSIGYSEARQHNTGGQLGNAFSIGRYASVNLLWYPIRNMTTGLELLWGERENNDGNNADDTRIQFTAKYDF